MVEPNELPEPCPHGGDPIECMSCLIDEYSAMKEAFTAIGIPAEKLPGLVEDTLAALRLVAAANDSWTGMAKRLLREWGETDG